MSWMSVRHLFQDLSLRRERGKQAPVAMGVCALILVLGSSFPCIADQPGPVLQIGFDGTLKLGRWTPVRVEKMPAGIATAEIRSLDPDGHPVLFPLKKSADGSWNTLIRSGKLASPIELRAYHGSGEDGRQVTSRKATPVTFRQSTQFWIVMGKHPGFEAAARLLNQTKNPNEPEPVVRVISLETEELPQTAEALDAVDVLICTEVPADGPASTALFEWVQQGGRLVVSLDGNQHEPDTAAWLPFTVGPIEQVTQTTEVKSRISGYVPNSGQLISLQPSFAIPRVTLKDGVVLVDGPSGPLITRSAVGFGTVTCVAVNLNQPPFYSKARNKENNTPLPSSQGEILWDGLIPLCLQVSESRQMKSGSATERQRLQLTPSGISDMQTQLLAALDTFDSVSRYSMWNVIGLLMGYLILIGAIDYFLVHRILRRPEWTWVTLPIWIVLASWWSTSMAARLNGSDMWVKQLEVIDVAADTKWEQRHNWFTVYSPRTRRYSVTTETPSTRTRIFWASRPEEGFRGMYRETGIDLGNPEYQATPSELRGVPISLWSSKAFAGESNRVLPSRSEKPLAWSEVELDLSNEVTGALHRYTFQHFLPGTISDWFLAHGTQVHFPRSPELVLEPGKKYDLRFGVGQQLLRVFIQGERTEVLKIDEEKSEIRFHTQHYNPFSTDMMRILKTISFYQAVDGPAFTGLSNETLSRMDLSRHTHLDRLIVIGRYNGESTELRIDGATPQNVQRDQYIRLIVPVETPPPKTVGQVVD